jgi:hypothetical protein
VKVTVTFELDEATARLITGYSVERVINTSMGLITRPDLGLRDANLEDWEECKPVSVAMWNAVRDAVFREKASITETGAPWLLRKGELV